MREYVLTDNERAILKRFVSTGDRMQGLSMLVFRAKQSERRLSEDLALVKKALRKAGS